MRYLFKRHGSDNWYIRLQPPGRPVIEKSLGTSDLKAAEIAALPLIREHKAFMYARRHGSAFHETWQTEFEPGLHARPDGGHVLATERELTFTDAAGKIASTRPNGGPVQHLQLPPAMRMTLQNVVDAYAAEDRPTPAVKNGDDALLETYIAHKGISGYREREARDMWYIFKTVVGKPLRQCTRDDGRDIVKYLEDVAGEPIKSTTLTRKLVPLVALVNLAIEEGKLTFNPFVSVVPKRKDADIRLPFDAADMALIRANLSRLDASDQLLLRLLATTGMRRGEAFQIDHEQTEGGCRFAIAGTKTEQSLRRVPFPKALLPHLPAKIKGKLFAGKPNEASKRLNGFLRDIGIADRRKVVHSFRHRAADRLRAAGVPEDMRWALLGHEHKTVASGYGKGFPVSTLRKAIDKIGF